MLAKRLSRCDNAYDECMASLKTRTTPDHIIQQVCNEWSQECVQRAASEAYSEMMIAANVSFVLPGYIKNLYKGYLCIFKATPFEDYLIYGMLLLFISLLILLFIIFVSKKCAAQTLPEQM